MTSSSRSAGSVRSGRQDGGVTVPGRVRVRSTVAAHLLQVGVRPARAGDRQPGRARRAAPGPARCAAAARGWSHLDRRRRSVAPPSSASSCTARADATGASSGSTPRSNRLDASLEQLVPAGHAGDGDRRRSARPRSPGRSSPASISVVSAAHGRRPAPIGPGPSVMSRSSGSRSRVDVVERLQPLARRRPADDDRPAAAGSGRRRAAAGRVSSIT